MVDSTTYQEIEERITKRYAAEKTDNIIAHIEEILVPYWPESYGNPMGQLPPVIVEALDVIELELHPVMKQKAEAKLKNKLIQGMEALLYAD